MLQYVIAGLAFGGIYAIAAAGLVVTYQSAGVLNFAFGGLAYFIARLYYFLHATHGWGIGPAAVVSIVLASPALGVLLYLALFRLLALASTLIKIVTTVGLSVALAAIATMLFGSAPINVAPGLAPQPVKVFHVDGVPVDMNKVTVYIAVVAVVVIGTLVLRYTDVGLRVRAMVDSPAMTSLSGTNPRAVAVGVWAASTFLAGLVGVIAGPIIGLSSTDPSSYVLLMAAAFAAVIAGQLRNLPVAVLVGLLMGVAGDLVQYALPPNSTITRDIIPSIPFATTALFLIYFILRSGKVSEVEGIGGSLDRAIAVNTDGTARLAAMGLRNDTLSWVGPAVILAVVCALPFILHGLWVGTLTTGLAWAVLFLSFTLVIGEGGMVWLCMITFAGVGALTAGQLAAVHGWPVLAAIVVGGLVALPMGIIIGALTIRLGDLYVALVTLTFGLLMENLVFSDSTFLNQGLGRDLNTPSFLQSNRAMSYFLIAIFVVIALFVVNVRRSTTGMALTAVRRSEPAAKTLGISVLQMKVIVAGIAAFIAGIGGGLYALTEGVARPADYETILGLVLVAVVATLGIRSNIAALVAGLSFAFGPALVQQYLPIRWGQLTTVLFGLGAIAVAKNPDGTIADQARQIRGLLARLSRRNTAGPVDEPLAPQGGNPAAPVGAPDATSPVGANPGVAQ